MIVNWNLTKLLIDEWFDNGVMYIKDRIGKVNEILSKEAFKCKFEMESKSFGILWYYNSCSRMNEEGNKQELYKFRIWNCIKD